MIDAQCREVKRIDTAAAFFLSIDSNKPAIWFIEPTWRPLAIMRTPCTAKAQ